MLDDATRQWIEPLVRELLSRPDPASALTGVDTARLPMQAWQVIGSLGRGEPPPADDVDWLGVGAILREALGWTDYPAVPPSD
ncbi:MAG: hypothetical protein KDB70_04255 [Mycobacterium sp.]|nr:hypothetical protein [Mycobacterium sp.]